MQVRCDGHSSRVLFDVMYYCWRCDPALIVLVGVDDGVVM